MAADAHQNSPSRMYPTEIGRKTLCCMWTYLKLSIVSDITSSNPC